MDPVGVKHEKLYQPPPPRAADPKPEAPAKEKGPTGNAILDALPAPASSEERKSLADFALRAAKPLPQNAPVDRKPIGHVLIEKLQTKPTWAELLEQAKSSSNPNASIGPVAADSGTVTAGAAAEKECKAVVKTLGGLPVIGKAVEQELEDLCVPPTTKSLGTLPNVPITKPTGTALPNTSAEGGDKPWTPIGK